MRVRRGGFSIHKGNQKPSCVQGGGGGGGHWGGQKSFLGDDSAPQSCVTHWSGFQTHNVK